MADRGALFRLGLQTLAKRLGREFFAHLLGAFHRHFAALISHGQVRRGLRDVCVTEPDLHLVEWNTPFQPSRSGFAPQVVKVEIDGSQCGA